MNPFKFFWRSNTPRAASMKRIALAIIAVGIAAVIVAIVVGGRGAP